MGNFRLEKYHIDEQEMSASRHAGSLKKNQEDEVLLMTIWNT